MTRAALVLRPEPGTGATASRLRAAGLETRLLPLFERRAIPWSPPAADSFDSLLLTSAAAARLAGPNLARLVHLPVVTVGEATATAARAAGLTVAFVGHADAAAAVEQARAGRLLHLAGRERVALPGVAAVTVYASEELPLTPAQVEAAAHGAVALLHSARAARRFATLVGAPARAGTRIAALSAAVRDAAGPGWAAAGAAPRPTDEALVALAARLAIDHRSPPRP